MKLIIDSNCLRAPALASFLEESPDNIAVLPDLAVIEAYGTSSIGRLVDSFAMLARHPRQLLVLKSSVTVGRLAARTSGLQRRLIDTGQTREFPQFVQHLRSAQQGDAALGAEINGMRLEAELQLGDLDALAPPLLVAFGDLEAALSERSLEAIRAGGNYPPETIEPVMQLTRSLTAYLIVANEIGSDVPDDKTIKNLFYCRLALAVTLLFVSWIAAGRKAPEEPGEFRADFVGAHYVAYSTYFDGLLTADKARNALASQARYILSL